MKILFFYNFFLNLKAPEHAGNVIGRLIKIRACQQSAVLSLIDTLKSTSISEDFGLGEVVITDIYTRLKNAVTSYSA